KESLMNLFSEHQMITVHEEDWGIRQRQAGACGVGRLYACRGLILNTIDCNLLDVDKIVIEIMKQHDCTPTFFNYKGFPSTFCTSVNKELVHGIIKDYEIQEGDVVKVDLGATFNGAIADAAITVIKGKARNVKHIELVNACKEALENAIAQIS